MMHAIVLVECGDRFRASLFTACNVAIQYHEEQPGYIVKTAKAWLDERDYCRLTLYYRDRIEKYVSEQKCNGAIPDRAVSFIRYLADDEWPILNPYDKVPIFHFGNRASTGMLGCSELKEAIPVQDALNKSIADMLVASEFYGIPQRYATGIEDVGVEQLKEKYKLVAGGVWGTTNKDVKFGQFEAADISKYIEISETFRKEMARVSRTPLHYFSLQGSMPSGEALALDTLVPTPLGLRPISEIEKGDTVYDEQGERQEVLEAFSVLYGRPCYRVTFDTGASFVTDRDHKWLAGNLKARKVRARRGYYTMVNRPKVITTGEMSLAVKAGNARQWLLGSGVRKGLQNNYSIPVAGALKNPPAILPLDPYLLGCWLGDGSKYDALLTVGISDLPEFQLHLEATGAIIQIRPEPHRDDVFDVVFNPLRAMCRQGHPRDPERVGKKCRPCDNLAHYQRHRGLGMPPPVWKTGRDVLREDDLLCNKHIPEKYFQASREQRLALLQGLMDTDGHCNKNGYPEIALSNKKLARDVHRLILSLGHKVKMRVRDSKHYGRVVNQEYRMIWSAPDPVFRLSRKLMGQKFVISDKSGARSHYIESIVPVPSVPVRCLRVNGPSHLFLIGEHCIPTHNSFRVAEAPLTKKALDRQDSFGAIWSDAMRFALQIDSAGDHEPETKWGSVEIRDDDAEVNRAAVKHESVGVPVEILWKELGYTEKQIVLMRALAEKEAEQMMQRQQDLAATRGSMVAAKRKGRGQDEPVNGGGMVQ